MLNTSKNELRARHVAELAALRARHRAELAAWRAAWRAAKAQEKQERKKKADVDRWKKNDFFCAISVAYQTEKRRRIYALAQMFRRRHGITTAEEVVAFKAKLEKEKAARAEEKESHRKQLNQKKELFEAIARAYKTENSRQIYALAQIFRRRHGITTAAEVVAYKEKLETEKAVRAAEKEKKAADRAQKKEQARRKKEQASLKKEVKSEQRKKIKEKKEDLKKQGYICLGDVFELFNKCRREAVRTTISQRGCLYNYLKRFRVRWVAVNEKEKFYCKQDVIDMATAQDKRGPNENYLKSKSVFPLATPLDLETGEYCTRGAFSRMAGISKSCVLYHSKHADFKMLTHPSSGEALLHIPTAAAYFVAYAAQPDKKKSP